MIRTGRPRLREESAVFAKQHRSCIADVTDFGKDREISDGATREFLIAEAALKECVFLRSSIGCTR